MKGFPESESKATMAPSQWYEITEGTEQDGVQCVPNIYGRFVSKIQWK